MARLSLTCLVLVIALAVSTPAQDKTPELGPTPTVKITSPLGRTGTPATVRIVAQVQWPLDEDKALQTQGLTLRVLVDDVEVGLVENGPPYAVNWADENPFEKREIAVEAALADGRVVTDRVSLPAFEVADRAEVSSIVVDAAVYDAAGRPVSDLAESEFTLLENGELQQIDLFSREALPSTLVLLVDNSQSMARRLDGVKRAAEQFAKSLGPDDRMIVVPFNHTMGTITGPTNDVPTISEAIAAMKAGGGTAILNAVQFGSSLLEGAAGRRGIILITDGFDENSTIDIDAALEAAQRQQTTIYTVGIGGVTGVSIQGENTFRKITERTGGRAFFPWRNQDVPGVARDIIKDQETRYLLTYTPKNQRKDGTWRSIAINLRAGHRVRARDGYRAPEPPPVRPTLEFTVLDPQRGFVAVSPDDLEVVEDGVVQKIEAFQEAVDPVAIALLLDMSGSMTRSAEAVRVTAREFVKTVRSEDSLALITFNDQPLFGHLLGTDRQLTLDAIDKYEPEGGTTLYDGLWNGLQHLKRNPGRRAVVLLSDGKDENRAGTGPASTHTLQQVQDLAREVGATIFPIGLGTNVDGRVLRQMAEASGGEVYMAVNAVDLTTPFRGIVENLRQRYVLSYTSTNSEHNGSWRRVHIRIRTPGLMVRAAEGYYAPNP